MRRRAATSRTVKAAPAVEAMRSGGMGGLLRLATPLLVSLLLADGQAQQFTERRPLPGQLGELGANLFRFGDGREKGAGVTHRGVLAWRKQGHPSKCSPGNYPGFYPTFPGKLRDQSITRYAFSMP